MSLKRMEIEETDSFEQFSNEQKEINLYNEFDYLDLLGDTVYHENLDSKILSLNMNTVSPKRKDELFKRQKWDQ